MADPKVEMLYEDPEEPEEGFVRAVKTMPLWGQVFAWLSWRMPLGALFLAALGVNAAYFGGWVSGVSAIVADAALVVFFFWAVYCRNNYPNPWRFAVIVTRRPIPRELREAALRGEPVPPEIEEG
jgi:hypothetical protein